MVEADSAVALLLSRPTITSLANTSKKFDILRDQNPNTLDTFTNDELNSMNSLVILVMNGITQQCLIEWLSIDRSKRGENSARRSKILT
jgi:hypothetical protein